LFVSLAINGAGNWQPETKWGEEVLRMKPLKLKKALLSVPVLVAFSSAGASADIPSASSVPSTYPGPHIAVQPPAGSVQGPPSTDGTIGYQVPGGELSYAPLDLLSSPVGVPPADAQKSAAIFGSSLQLLNAKARPASARARGAQAPGFACAVKAFNPHSRGNHQIAATARNKEVVP